MPGYGWEVRYPDGAKEISHGMCPWCAAEAYGVPIQKVAVAAERLRFPAGMLEVRGHMLNSGARFVVIGDGRRTGWSGLVNKVVDKTVSAQ